MTRRVPVSELTDDVNDANDERFVRAALAAKLLISVFEDPQLTRGRKVPCVTVLRLTDAERHFAGVAWCKLSAAFGWTIFPSVPPPHPSPINVSHHRD